MGTTNHTAQPSRWSPPRSTSLSSRSAPSASPVTRVTGSCVSTPAGASPRVSTRVSADASGAPRPCPALATPNKKTRYMMPSGHKAFLVNNTKDVELLLMHNRTYAAEIAHGVSSRKRVDIIARAKQLGVKVTNSKAKVTTEV